MNGRSVQAISSPGVKVHMITAEPRLDDDMQNPAWVTALVRDAILQDNNDLGGGDRMPRRVDIRDESEAVAMQGGDAAVMMVAAGTKVRIQTLHA